MCLVDDSCGVPPLAAEDEEVVICKRVPSRGQNHIIS